ncbi:uncharacterized protein LOC110265293 [Arachis ipaensis]|uniref:uncharacterized protein LOC110265293 n=1 Tax=Arachis ipaensis TaxID=130454 RepID=UPI000A2B418E|nr:uncharacterized protein LOC110265293 [Arachis ipaensis]XP_029150741.1 uncharacterized protein LOC114925779 [Arachis hypogaea]
MLLILIIPTKVLRLSLTNLFSSLSLSLSLSLSVEERLHTHRALSLSLPLSVWKNLYILIVLDFFLQAPHWLTYDFPPQIREKLNIQWGSDWKGQAQKWFLFKFTSQDQEINYLGDGTEKAEFGEWSWLPPEKVIELVSNGDCDKHFFTPI